MSSSLVVIGLPCGPTGGNRIAEIASELYLDASFDIHPSVKVVAQLLAKPNHCCFTIDAPESGTATELEDECASLGMGARLPRFLETLMSEELLTEVRLAWSWDFPDPAISRHEEGSVADLVALLSRSETWGQRVEVRPGVFHLSFDSIFVFCLTGCRQCSSSLR